MTRRGLTVAAAAAALALPPPARAQTGVCGPAPAAVSPCAQAVAALEAAYPEAGILAAGGNPVPGVESTRGITLGIVPRTTASLRVSAARQHLPDLGVASTAEDRSATATSIRLGTATQLFSGVSAGPIGGVGAIDLLLDVALLPAAGQGRDAAAAFGAGARIGVIRETFGTPGVSLTAMYRHVGRQQYGHICPVPDVSCDDPGAAEAAFATNDLSGRLTVGKRLGPVGVLGGVGVDRFSTSGGRVSYIISPSVEPVRIHDEVSLHDTRWSVFGNLSYGLIVGSLVAEAGYMGGGDPTVVFDADDGQFEPGKGTPFGSLALRISL